jgi:hypothetical protein
MTNEAAERLRNRISGAVLGMDVYWNSDSGDSDKLAEAMQALRLNYAADLRKALAAERRVTVERIRAALDELTDVGTSYVKRSRFVAILDEEAAR